jgi:hypothetical protein
MSPECTYLCNKQKLHPFKIHIPYHLIKLFNATKISIKFGFKKTHILIDKKMFNKKNEYKGLWYKKIAPTMSLSFLMSL